MNPEPTSLTHSGTTYGIIFGFCIVTVDTSSRPPVLNLRDRSQRVSSVRIGKPGQYVQEQVDELDMDPFVVGSVARSPIPGILSNASHDCLLSARSYLC